MSEPVLRPGDAVPHFEVETLQGGLINYSTIWQRRNLVIVALPALESGVAERYVSRLTAKAPEFRARRLNVSSPGSRAGHPRRRRHRG